MSAHRLETDDAADEEHEKPDSHDSRPFLSRDDTPDDGQNHTDATHTVYAVPSGNDVSARASPSMLSVRQPRRPPPAVAVETLVTPTVQPPTRLRVRRK